MSPPRFPFPTATTKNTAIMIKFNEKMGFRFRPMKYDFSFVARQNEIFLETRTYKVEGSKFKCQS
jgi:hypothetical protein